jgi:hypothetical protein
MPFLLSLPFVGEGLNIAIMQLFAVYKNIRLPPHPDVSLQVGIWNSG